MPNGFDLTLLAFYVRNFITIAGNTLLVLSLSEPKRPRGVSIPLIVLGFLASIALSTLLFTPSGEIEFVSSSMVLCCLIVAATVGFQTRDSFFQITLNIFTQLNLYFIISYLAYTLTASTFFDNIWGEIYIRLTLYLIIVAVFFTLFRKPYRKYIKYLTGGWINLTVISCAFSIFFTFVFLLPVPFYEREYYNHYICISAIVLMVLIYIMAILTFKRAVQNMKEEAVATRRDRQLRSLQGQLIARRENEETIKKMRHDLRHHDAILLTMLEDGKIGEAKRFLAEHGTRIAQIKDMIYCRNSVVNAILANYAGIAVEKGYRVDIVAHIPENIAFDPVDLAGLLANIVENAIEACDKVTAERPYIDMRCMYKNGTLRIAMSNSCPEKPDFIGGLPQTNKTVGGIGLQSVMSVVERYDGLANFAYENGAFVTKIMIQEPRG